MSLVGQITGALGVTYDPAGGSVVEGSFYDTPLTIEREELVRREIVPVHSELFADGFESGDLSAWSSTVP